MAEEHQGKYVRSTDKVLRQGEIISGLIQIKAAITPIGDESRAAVAVTHPFAIVLTQDCDLEQHSLRIAKGEDGTLPNILLCEAQPAAALRASAPGKDIWKRIRQNQDERYQCLERVPAEDDALQQGIDSLGVDFKRYFTVPTAEVFERLHRGDAKRRACLSPAYKQHLASRFFYFQMRVALPAEHQVD